MERKILKTENGVQELEIIINDDVFQTYYDAAYNKIKNKLSIPGFRKGKVPFHVAKKQFGGMIQEQAIEEAAQGSFEKIVEEDKIHLISRPELTNVDINNGVVKFNFTYGVYPTVTLNEYKGLKVDEPVHAVSEDEVEVEISKILNSQGTFEDAEIVDDENFVVGLSFLTLDNDTKEVKTDIEPFEDSVYLNNEKIDAKLVEAVIGAKVGEKVEYIYEHDQPHDEHQHEAGETHQHIYQVEVKDIQKLIPAVLTDEFVKTFTKEKFDNIEDFKEDLEFALQEQWDKKCRAAVEDQIVAKLVNDNNIDAPEPFVQNAIEILVNNFLRQYGDAAKNVKREIFNEQFHPIAVRNVQWELIRNKIIEVENIEVEDYDIDQLATQEAAKTGRKVEEFKKVIETNENLKMQILNRKVIDFILDFAVTNEVPYEDIMDEEM